MVNDWLKVFSWHILVLNLWFSSVVVVYRSYTQMEICFALLLWALITLLLMLDVKLLISASVGLLPRMYFDKTNSALWLLISWRYGHITKLNRIAQSWHTLRLVAQRDGYLVVPPSSVFMLAFVVNEKGVFLKALRDMRTASAWLECLGWIDSMTPD